MTEITVTIIILIILLLLSAFFSGTETALFSLGKGDLARLKESKDKKSKKIVQLMKFPRKILITILLGNLFSNLLFSQISARFFMDSFDENGHFIALLIITPVIIIFCEIIPKVISIYNSESFSRLVINIISFFHLIFLPLRSVFLVMTNFLLKIFGIKSYSDNQITERELDKAIEMWENSGVILSEESSFIKNVLRFSKKNAENVMIPRNEAIAIHSSSTVTEATEVFLKNNIVRAPVYNEDMDDIIGGLDARDILSVSLTKSKKRKITKFIFPIKHYPETIDLNLLLDDFLKNKIQLAAVIDEYGGTAGIVTLSSIISQLLGTDFSLDVEKKKQGLKKIDNSTFIVSGDYQIDDFNLDFNENISTTEAETIAGYITEKLEHLPKKGESISTSKHEIKIRYIRKNKVESLEIRKITK